MNTYQVTCTFCGIDRVLRWNECADSMDTAQQQAIEVAEQIAGVNGEWYLNSIIAK